jgi:uncharacterized protein
MAHTLLIFIKNPVPGTVKTRLAATVGDEAALHIYLQLLEKTRAVAVRLPNARRMLFYSTAIELNDDWPGDFFEKQVQQGADLGARMSEAFRMAFATGATKAVIIGSDCPTLSEYHLEQAYEALHHNDCVIGPTPDGGYYLLGLSQHTPALFDNMAWSTETVRSETIHRLEQMGHSYYFLPLLSDIDTESDWLAYLAQQ